jgi:riboflavin kinase/FMN adenylyltransferase
MEDLSSMQMISDLASLSRGKPTVLTIGTFDGVHRGHQWLIRQTVERARALDYDSMVLTFDPAPQVVLRPGSVQLTDGQEKARIIAALGPTTLVMLPFTSELSHVPAPEFLVSILDHVNLAEVWLGADFLFGHNREGNVDLLIRSGQHSCFSVHVVYRRGLHGSPISSTRVRELIREGNVEQAAVLLGHYPSLSGKVVTGFGRGTELGFPTANVQPSAAQLLPATGVYAAYLRFDGNRLHAAVSVGYNVVFGGEDIVVEAYVLDFTGDLRNKIVGVDFVARVSDEQHFESVDGLVTKMHGDVEQVRRILVASEEPGELILSP